MIQHILLLTEVCMSVVSIIEHTRKHGEKP